MSQENELRAIVALLSMLAEQCGEKASDNRLAFVASEIAQHGTQRCVDTLKLLMRSARRFPTVAEIEKEMGVGASSLNADDIGREVADRMYAAIAKFRASGEARAMEYIGPLGPELVKQLGGWPHICATTEEKNATIHKAQWRESAAILAEKAKRGDLFATPGAALAAIPQKDGLTGVTPETLARLIGKQP